jgi:hypothetical protein
MKTSTRIVGSVASLWRYPVKSMLGEEVNASEITTGGLLGDRAYALIDSSDGRLPAPKIPGSGPPCSTSALRWLMLQGSVPGCRNP